QPGIDGVNTPKPAPGPDMAPVEALVQNDSSLRGMRRDPKYSNPTDQAYSEETVQRIAKLGPTATTTSALFRDNDYSVHELIDNPPQLANISEATRRHQTEDSVIQFASTSKITHAGSGVAFVAASASNLAGFKKFLNTCTIGPDKVNQIRHSRFLPDEA